MPAAKDREAIIKFAATAAAIVLLSAPQAIAAAPFTLAAHDGFALSGDLYGLEGADRGVLLLHQCNMDRRSWSGLAPKLEAAGLSVMTLDFRGKGESRKGDFEGRAGEHFPQDTEAALALFQQHLAPGARLAVMGASCGGNQAFLAAPKRDEIKALVIFSSTLTEDDAAWTALAARADIAVLGIGASADGETVSHARRAVEASSHPASELIVYEGSRHGVPLFEQDPALADRIAGWIGARLAE